MKGETNRQRTWWWRCCQRQMVVVRPLTRTTLSLAICLHSKSHKHKH